MFFGISGLDATYMDPQQRIFLEEAWKALEHGGHAGAGIEGRRCGVFVGCSAGDYQELFRSQPPGQAFWGNTSSLIPARVSLTASISRSGDCRRYGLLELAGCARSRLP